MADTKFWGVEAKAGQPVKCDPGFGRYLHLSQAALGEIKNDKGSVSVPIYVKVDDQKLVLGTLSSEKCFQISFDLVFEREFVLSHNWKHGSIYFFGYYTTIGEEDTPEGFTDTDSDSEEDHQLIVAENGKSEVKDAKSKAATNKANVAKSESSDNKPKVKIEEPKRANDNNDESDDDDETEEDMSDDDEDMVEAGDHSDNDEEDEDSLYESSEVDETTPKKVETTKRKPAEFTSKMLIPEKKAKLAMPSSQKSSGDVKKGGHTATPYPSKHAGKTPATANDNKSKPRTPKSGGPVTCKSCSKTFNSDIALKSHTKAKHSAGK